MAGCALLVLLGIVPGAFAADRAYEMVSPVDKGGTDVAGFAEPFASESGDVSVFPALNALPGADPVSNGVLNWYRAVRTPDGWTASQLSSPLGAVNNLNSVNYTVFSSDLMAGVQTGPVTPPATPEAVDGANNLYLSDASGFHLITPGIDTSEFFTAEAFGGSDDLGRVVFAASGTPLDPEAPPVFGLLYEWDRATQTPKIVGRLPDGTPSQSSVSIATPPGVYGPEGVSFNPVSRDGRRVFFYTEDEDGPGIFVRIDGTETKEASESQRTVPDPISTSGPIFRVASADGSAVFFTSAKKLTDDATTGPSDEGNDLYRYDVDSGELIDVTVDIGDTAGAEVRGVLGTAADGSRVYFVARGVLDAGAVAGEENLYLWTDDGSPGGEVAFVAADASNLNWFPNYFSPIGPHVAARVTPDGSHLLFVSDESLTGYPNEGNLAVYLYDAGSGELRCASCNPSGAPATANAAPAGAGDAVHVARTLSADGSRVFFNTPERLAVRDTNSATDVYEYDALADRVNLISSGKGDNPSRFSDASLDGSDVLFTTREQLVGIDRDGNVDVYDARIGGGIAAQNPPPPAPPCEGDACRGPVSAPPPATAPASTQVVGPRDLKPRHKHRRKKHKRRHHKKKHHSQSRGAHR
jgi:Tol biopolymer transport system component